MRSNAKRERPREILKFDFHLEKNEASSEKKFSIYFARGIIISPFVPFGAQSGISQLRIERNRHIFFCNSISLETKLPNGGKKIRFPDFQFVSACGIYIPARLYYACYATVRFKL